MKLSNYYHAMLLLRDHGDAVLAEAELRKATATNPNYAPALLALARLLAGWSDTSKEGLQLGWQAVQREDMRVGYHLAFGYVLLRAGKAEQAELAAKHASDMYADAVEKSEAARLLALAQQCQVKHDCAPKMRCGYAGYERRGAGRGRQQRREEGRQDCQSPLLEGRAPDQF